MGTVVVQDRKRLRTDGVDKSFISVVISVWR